MNFLRKVLAGRKMIGPNFADNREDFGSFFDQIDDLLDFPAEDGDSLTEAATSPVNCDYLANIWTAESDSLPCSDSVFPGDRKSGLAAELSVPYEDMVQLEWLSNFVEDSLPWGSLTMKKVDQPSCTTEEDSLHNQFRTVSPVSVPESSGSFSGEKTSPRSPEIYIPVPCGRARSKRPRPATFNPHPVMQLLFPASSVGESTQPNNVTTKASSNSENFAESHHVFKMPKQPSGEQKKNKKIKQSVPLGGSPDSNQNAPSQSARKCMHCEITKTPQWRTGPMGLKTLCNACGVRFKSGRLFPEYRPAASPTFCPSLHSNSHKKVLELRNKTGEKSGFATDSAASPELIPSTNSSLTPE